MPSDPLALIIADDALRASKAAVVDARDFHGAAGAAIKNRLDDVTSSEERVALVAEQFDVLPIRDGRDQSARTAKSFKAGEAGVAERAATYLKDNFVVPIDQHSACLISNIWPVAKIRSYKSHALRVGAIVGAWQLLQSGKPIDAGRFSGHSRTTFALSIEQALIASAEAQRIAVHVGDRTAVDPSLGLPRAILQAPITSDTGEVDAAVHRLGIMLLMDCDRASPSSEAEVSLRSLCNRMGGIRPARLAEAVEKLKSLEIKGGPEGAAERLFGNLEIRESKGYLSYSISSEFAVQALRHRANRAIFPIDITALQGLTSAAQSLLLLAISTDAIAGEQTCWRISPNDLADCLGIPATIANRAETVRRLIAGMDRVAGWRFGFEVHRDHRRRGGPVSTIDISITRTKVVIGSGLRAVADPQFEPDLRVAGRPYDCPIPSILEGKPVDWDWRRRGDEVSPRSTLKAAKPAILDPVEAPVAPKSYRDVAIKGFPAIRVWPNQVALGDRTAVPYTPAIDGEPIDNALRAIEALYHASTGDRERETLLDLRRHIRNDPQSLYAA